MDRDFWQQIAEWKKRNGKNLAVWTAFLTAGALLILCGAAAAGCSQKRQQDKTGGGQAESRMEESRESGTGIDDVEGKAVSGASGRQDSRISGGSSGKITYEVRSLEKEYAADDGTGIFHLKLSWPELLGDGEGVGKINAFFEAWAEDRLREYDANENSTRQSALEVYRESRDVGWGGPWGEEYRVASVGVCAGYVSVLLDSCLYEGNVHGMPYREDYAFDLSDGSRAGLAEMSGRTKGEWEKLLREKFLAKISEEDGYYADAGEILEKFDFAKAGWYFSDEGIVFYLPPYTVAPYDRGYVEVTVPFREARIK